MPVATAKPNRQPVPAGVQHAVCYQVIDIGTQPQHGNFPSRRKVMIVWELPNERGVFEAKDGSTNELPRAISKDYTLSLDKKANLRKDLEAWRGRPFTAEEAEGFEVGKLLGANCQLNVVHKPSADGTRIYANVAGIMPLAKGMKILAPENPTILFDLPKQGPVDFPQNLPEWMCDRIKASDEYKDLINPPQRQQGSADRSEPALEEDVPF